MTAILFWDHSFHHQTGSSQFFQDILAQVGDVKRVWETRVRVNNDNHAAPAIPDQRFDVVVFFQTLPPIHEILKLGCRNKIWVPMEDALPKGILEKIAQTPLLALLKKHLRIICFSKSLFNKLELYGFNCIYTQYFPPVPRQQVAKQDVPRVFFWQRQPIPDMPLLATLLGKSVEYAVILRQHYDPDRGANEITEADTGGIRIERLSGWLSRNEYLNTVRTADVFMAPRYREGIGQSLLEAMAMGCCVISADVPTANEYIKHGHTGILFDPARPRAVDLRDRHAIGSAARQFVAEGHKQWMANIPQLHSFILSKQS